MVKEVEGGKDAAKDNMKKDMERGRKGRESGRIW